MGTKIETDIIYGENYTDKVTGFTGRVVSITKWQFGCIRIALRPVVNKDGEMQEEQWFDEESLEGVTQKQPVTGGPTKNPKRNIDPKI